MKRGILLLLLISSVYVHAQSLKEALYGGKLKNQPGTVIRKGDDLTSKIDTTQRKPATDETAKTDMQQLAMDSSSQSSTIQTDSASLSATDSTNSSIGSADTAVLEATAPSTENIPAPKSNNVLWKEYVDVVSSTLKTEALSSKKVKRGSYYVLVSYTIDTVGQVTVGDVFLSPENAFLQQQIKERFASDTPRLAPVLSSSGVPRKVNKKYNFTLVKE